MIDLFTIHSFIAIGIVFLIANSLFIIGVFQVTNEGKVLHFVRKGLIWLLMGRGWALEYLFDGLLGCLECMSTIWGVVFLSAALVNMDISLIDFIFSYKIFLVPIYTLSLSQVLTPIYSIINYINFPEQ